MRSCVADLNGTVGQRPLEPAEADQVRGLSTGSKVTDSRATSPIRRRASTFTRTPILTRAVRAATAAITATGSATSQR